MITKPFEVVRKSRNVHICNVPLVKNKDWEWRCLLRSDAHHDHVHCDQKLERKHLEEAKACGAGIIDAGDLFCAMQGKYDPRKSYSALRPEYKVDNYLDSLVEVAGEFYAPFAQNIIALGRGNHEGSIYDRQGTDLTERLCERLSTKSCHTVHSSGYSGYVKFSFCDGLARGAVESVLLWHFHGHGGGGPVTRDVIKTNRQAVYNPDPRIILTGHTHDQWVLPIQRNRISSQGVIYQDAQLHIKTPSYKDEYQDGFGGWEVSRGGVPKPKGAIWLIFKWSNPANGIVIDTAFAQ